MRTFNLHFTGLFGNRMYEYCFARGYAETHGYELRTEEWVGRKLFQCDESLCEPCAPTHGEEELLSCGPAGDVIHFQGYAQQQRAIDYYTRAKARAWLKWRPHIREQLQELGETPKVMAHLRRGDYAGAGYALVSVKSYLDACRKFGVDPQSVVFTSEENALRSPYFTDPHFGTNVTQIPDFWRLCQADVLFRANSSFSWWAAVLGNASRTFAPIVSGKTGGIENDCEFVAGNWPRLCDLGFVTDLHLSPA